MKLKFGRVLLLSLFLFLLPLSVFARSSPTEDSVGPEDIRLEERAPVEKEPVKEVGTSDLETLKKIEGGGYYRSCRKSPNKR